MSKPMMVMGAVAVVVRRPRWALTTCVVVASACSSAEIDKRQDAGPAAPTRAESSEAAVDGAEPRPSRGEVAAAAGSGAAGDAAAQSGAGGEAGSPDRPANATAAGSGNASGSGGREASNNAAGSTGGAGVSAANNSAGADAKGGGSGGAAAGGGAAPSAQACAGINKLDLLFVVDNSNSMASEQESLKQQFPAIINALSSGRRPGASGSSFPAVQDMHVGVISADMGIPGVEFPSGNCRADGGDDGRLLHRVPDRAGCDPSYPSFLTYLGPKSAGPTTDAVKFSNDVGCIASLGTGGCGFEQQLEAPFKALWPKVQMDAAGQVIEPNQYRFIANTEPGTWGKGDVPEAQGGNLGFLRNGPDAGGPSLIAVVLMTDEEDCSVKSTEHLKPNNQLPEDNPYRKEDINLRCYYHKEFLYDVKQRYFEGLRKLRPGREDLVVFAAITGVPTDLVGPDALAKVDFEADDPSSRNTFFDAILNDARMQEVLDPLTNPGSGQGNVKPSCSRTVPGETQPATSYPPRRIVELAKHFGKNGMVQSICQDDFAVVSSAVIDSIARKLERPCP